MREGQPQRMTGRRAMTLFVALRLCWMQPKKNKFFCFGHSNAAATNVQQEVDSYFNDDNCTLETLKQYPAVKQIFLKYNTVQRWWAETGTQT